MFSKRTAAIVAAVVSLMLEWFPGLRGWWDGFTSSQKQGIMAGLVFIISLAVMGVQCWQYDVCPANQGVHLLTKRPSSAVVVWVDESGTP